MFLQPCLLGVGVVVPLPVGELLAADALVLRLPGNQALGAGHGPAVGAHELLVLRVGQEPERTLGYLISD